MNNSEMRKVAAGASLFALVSVTLMLHRCATRPVMATDAAGVPGGGSDALGYYELFTGGFFSNGNSEGANASENGTSEPEGEYDRIVVINPVPAEDGSFPVDLTMETALLLKEMADSDPDHDIKFCYTRSPGGDEADDVRDCLVKDSGADLFIELEISGQGDGEDGVLTCYNDRFYLRSLSNASFADIMERNCAVCAGETALGLAACEDEDDMLMCSQIPSAGIRICASGEGGTRLLDEEYRQRLAQGIYSGIIEAFEVIR